jgi:hypothetical protein
VATKNGRHKSGLPRAGYSCAIVGGPETVRCGLGAEGLMVTANIFEHAKRKRSFEIVAEVHAAMKQTAAGQQV